MVTRLQLRVRTNSDDAFVAWAPRTFISGCRGFMLERERRGGVIEEVENRIGFAADKPKSGDHRPSSDWPFQRFNWTDHAVDVGNELRYRVTAMVDTGAGRPFQQGPASRWSAWARLSTSVGGGMSCYFNRGLVLSQFVARYLRDHQLSPAQFKAQLKGNVDPAFRVFLQGDLGVALFAWLQGAGKAGAALHAALYELDDAQLEDAMIAIGAHLNLVLANGSDKAGDGNAPARSRLNGAGIPTIDRLLKSKGLGHNKFMVASKGQLPKAVWTGSTNWSTTGLCTQVNNALAIEDKAVAAHYRAQWDRLKNASPPALVPAGFPLVLVSANDVPKTFAVGSATVDVWFTRTSDGRDMAALRELIAGAKTSILFLMFTPGAQGLHTLAAARAREAGMYVRGVVSTLGSQTGDTNFLDIGLVSSDTRFKPDRFSVPQPQGIGQAFGAWIAEVTRSDFLAQVGHAIVHSKVLVIDPTSEAPTVVTGSHNFSTPASASNDENFVIVRGHKELAAAYATNIMSVYQHYRYRSYVREMLAQGKKPWSNLEDGDHWLQTELQSKAHEIAFWT